MPVPPELRGQIETAIRTLFVLAEPLNRCEEILVVLVEPGQPLALLCAQQLRSGLTRQSVKPLRVGIAIGRGLAIALRFLRGELPHRLEQVIPRLISFVDYEQRLVDQMGEEVENLELVVRSTQDGGRGGKTPPAYEYRESAQAALLLVIEQTVTPGDRGPKGLVALERLMGLLLVAVAVQMFLQGLRIAWQDTIPGP